MSLILGTVSFDFSGADCELSLEEQTRINDRYTGMRFIDLTAGNKDDEKEAVYRLIAASGFYVKQVSFMAGPVANATDK